MRLIDADELNNFAKVMENICMSYGGAKMDFD